MKKIKLVKKHSHKSTRWLKRHLNDEYYLKSKTEGFRSRSSFKLIQIDERYDIFTKSFQNILDLGSAPGGWLQVAKKLTSNNSKIMGIDKLPIDEIEGVSFLQKDIFDNETHKCIKDYFGSKIDIIMSDMSPNTSGNKSVDHLKIISLVEIVLSIVENHLKKDGHFICKIFQGGAQGELVKKLNIILKSIRYFKPKASRLESPETYIVGKKK